MPNESLYLIWNLSWGEFTVFWVCLELRTHKKGSNLDSKEAKHLFHQSFSTTNSEVYRQRLISKETDFMRQKWSMTKFKGNWTVFPSILKDKSFINLNKKKSPQTGNFLSIHVEIISQNAMEKSSVISEKVFRI